MQVVCKVRQEVDIFEQCNDLVAREWSSVMLQGEQAVMIGSERISSLK